jgi:hypothetical protein
VLLKGVASAGMSCMRSEIGLNAFGAVCGVCTKLVIVTEDLVIVELEIRLQVEDGCAAADVVTNLISPS